MLVFRVLLALTLSVLLFGCGSATLNGYSGAARTPSVTLGLRDGGVATASALGPFDRVVWVNNDAVDFVDVFVSAPDSLGRFESNFLRLTQDASSRGDPDTRMTHFLVSAYRDARVTDPALRSLGIPTAFNAMRRYDIGQCSAVISWRSVLDAFIQALPAALAETAAEDEDINGLRIAGNSTIEGLFRETLPDGVRIVVPLQFEASVGDFRANMVITLGLHRARPGFQPFAESVTFTDVRDRDFLLWLATTVRDINLRDKLSASAVMARNTVTTAIGRLLPPQVLVAQRSHVRPEGVELVFVQDPSDTDAIRFFRGAGFCDRATTPAIVGYAGVTFDLIGTRVDPPVFSERAVPNLTIALPSP